MYFGNHVHTLMTTVTPFRRNSTNYLLISTEERTEGHICPSEDLSHEGRAKLLDFVSSSRTNFMQKRRSEANQYNPILKRQLGKKFKYRISPQQFSKTKINELSELDQNLVLTSAFLKMSSNGLLKPPNGSNPGPPPPPLFMLLNASWPSCIFNNASDCLSFKRKYTQSCERLQAK